MELKVSQLVIPEKITFNYEELKNELTAKVNEYKTIVYTEDQIAFAKKDRAKLNALKKSLNDERIRIEKEYMKPFDELKAQFKELCAILDEGASTIDIQVKNYEDQQKVEKEKAIKKLWEDHGADEWMMVCSSRWMNATTSLKSIEAEIIERLAKVQKDLDTLDSLGIGYEGIKKYQDTLDINQAISEDARIKKQAEEKAKWEAERAQITMEEIRDLANQIQETVQQNPAEAQAERQWIGFEAYLSANEAKALGAYLKSNNIKYRKPING